MHGIHLGRIVGNAHIERTQTVPCGAGTFPRLTGLLPVGCVSDPRRSSSRDSVELFSQLQLLHHIDVFQDGLKICFVFDLVIKNLKNHFAGDFVPVSRGVE
jgi:hypothetical protein